MNMNGKVKEIQVEKVVIWISGSSLTFILPSRMHTQGFKGWRERNQETIVKLKKELQS